MNWVQKQDYYEAILKNFELVVFPNTNENWVFVIKFRFKWILTDPTYGPEQVQCKTPEEAMEFAEKALRKFVKDLASELESEDLES